ncbi:conserved hy [Asticcacaulis biprosthecium C19]|uniref:Conserved hy n=1 Tax=Asticcacaulis biprosthecium C19 TaxID=715226 RepID=F4QIG9_9CAUL|nr:DUF3144 domain-containing protein [Asticcacaulis biprosthecium]EGF92958.1 conserved hy [Asticcacaulis biprosthecium C19]
MTQHIDPGFEARFNSFIATANSHLATTPPINVSVSLNEAAARYHAWVWAKMAPSEAEFAAKKAEAADYFVDQCRKMFEAHFDDYARNFDKNFPKDPAPKNPTPGS